MVIVVPTNCFNIGMLLWLDWNMVLNMAFIIMAVGYVVLSRLLRFSLVACRHKIWLGVGPIWLIDVIDCNGPVTIVLNRNVCSGIVVIAGHSVAL